LGFTINLAAVGALILGIVPTSLLLLVQTAARVLVGWGVICRLASPCQQVKSETPCSSIDQGSSVC
jgi:hypothetical protein